MSVEKRRRLEDAIERSVTISQRIEAKIDLEIREEILDLDIDGGLEYEKTALGIDKEAWARTEEIGIEPRLIFAHPKILQALPRASLYYRNIALLPLKRVQQIAGPVEAWEKPGTGVTVPDDKAGKVCRLYNAVIGSIILSSDTWSMNDGYRNILASMGISLDGTIRNIIGQTGEKKIKLRMIGWLAGAGLLTCKEDTKDRSRREFSLQRGVELHFGSEPDVAFIRSGDLVAVIEIKAGKDPAGAKERLGAIKKSFDQVPRQCKKFLVVGVVTPGMRSQLEDMHIDMDFNIDDLIEDDNEWKRFMNEIFHHALRITGEVS